MSWRNDGRGFRRAQIAADTGASGKKVRDPETRGNMDRLTHPTAVDELQ